MNPLVALVAGILTPSPSFGELVGAVRHQTRMKEALPSQVAYAAAAQTPAKGLRANLTGRTGGEDWADEEPSGDVAASSGLQHITAGLARSAPMPASWYAPNLPAELVEGRGTGYVTGAYNKGWVDLRAAGDTSWGASSGYGAAQPNVQTGTLLVPTDTTPRPRQMASAYQDDHQGHTRLSDMFGD